MGTVIEYNAQQYALRLIEEMDAPKELKQKAYVLAKTSIRPDDPIVAVTYSSFYEDEEPHFIQWFVAVGEETLEVEIEDSVDIHSSYLLNLWWNSSNLQECSELIRNILGVMRTRLKLSTPDYKERTIEAYKKMGWDLF